jgi:hypothetical protein
VVVVKKPLFRTRAWRPLGLEVLWAWWGACPVPAPHAPVPRAQAWPRQGVCGDSLRCDEREFSIDKTWGA